MLVDLIKRMVITEKYIYRNPEEQDQFELRLQKFKDEQAKQEQEEKEKQKELQGEKEKNDEGNETTVTNEIKTSETTETNQLTSNSMSLEKKDQVKQTNIKKVEYPTYAFDLDVRLTKPQIKVLLENVFNVDIVSLNTYIAPIKKKRVGFNQGYKARYKRAIIKLKPNQRINNPLDK